MIFSSHVPCPSIRINVYVYMFMYENNNTETGKRSPVAIISTSYDILADRFDDKPTYVVYRVFLSSPFIHAAFKKKDTSLLHPGPSYFRSGLFSGRGLYFSRRTRPVDLDFEFDYRPCGSLIRRARNNNNNTACNRKSNKPFPANGQWERP